MIPMGGVCGGGKKEVAADAIVVGGGRGVAGDTGKEGAVGI